MSLELHPYLANLNEIGIISSGWEKYIWHNPLQPMHHNINRNTFEKPSKCLLLHEIRLTD